MWDASAKTFSLGEARYLVDFSEQGIALEGPEDISLVTVFKVPKDSVCITETWIKDTVQRYQRDDDVFQRQFLAGVIFSGASEPEIEVSSEARSYLHSVGMRWMYNVTSSVQSEKLLPGPYCVVHGRIRNVWRLFKDECGTFMTALLSGTFQEVPLNCTDNGVPNIAVSSKLKQRHEACSPIAGWRVAAKDNFHIAGIHTSLGSMAYRRTFPPPSQTAVCLQTLTKLGAVIVGKTKLNPFGVWVEPIEYVDYQAPWNIRADGYQSSGGSSTGSAAAIAAYDWLDIAIGSDTCGSIMRPALWCGCFGLRPTFGTVSSEGLVISIDFFDVPSFLGRDLKKCREFADAWYGNTLPSTKPKPFSSIIWATDFWDVIDPAQHEIAWAFVRDLENHLGLKHTKVSFQEEWLKAPPEEATVTSLQEYMIPATTNVWYDFYHAFDEFREKHQEQYLGAPYLCPPVSRNMEIFKSISRLERDEGVRDLAIFRKWFNTQIPAGSEHPLYILPIENLSPRYRDEMPNFKKPPSGLNSINLAPLLDAPELIVPVGHIEYLSKITQNKESLPFAVGLMSAPGSDLMLMDVIHEALSKSGRPTSVHTGKMMF